MDYKYIEQLLERYWNCETSLEEEEILRTFFCQKEVPAELLRYQELFVYERSAHRESPLDSTFDERVLSIINEESPVKARTITLTHRLMPLFKAAAMVAIVLTLGNAAQVALNEDASMPANMAGYQAPYEGASVALSDSTVIDTLKQSNAEIPIQPDGPILK